MFSELPKLFDRNFAMGYVLPIILFFAGTLFLLDQFEIIDLVVVIENTSVLGTTLIIVGVWIASMLLLVFNWHIYRLLEGYHRRSPARLWAWLRNNPEQRRLSQINRQIKLLSAKGWDNLKNQERELLIEYRQERACRFPDDGWLLPTAFGNVIRAFEVYPRIMYGIEGIQGWNRLRAVIPKEYRELIDEAKALTDIWVNTWLLSFLLIFEYIALAFAKRAVPVIWFIPLMGVLIFLLWSRFAKDAAVGWGDMVKSAFDVYLPKLRAELDFKPFDDHEQERLFWEKYSQAIVYRAPKQLESLRPRNSLEEKNEEIVINMQNEVAHASEDPIAASDEEQKRKGRRK